MSRPTTLLNLSANQDIIDNLQVCNDLKRVILERYKLYLHIHILHKSFLDL